MDRNDQSEPRQQRSILVHLNVAERRRITRLKKAYGICSGVDVVRLALVELEIALVREETAKKSA